MRKEARQGQTLDDGVDERANKSIAAVVETKPKG